MIAVSVFPGPMSLAKTFFLSPRRNQWSAALWWSLSVPAICLGVGARGPYSSGQDSPLYHVHPPCEPRQALGLSIRIPTLLVWKIRQEGDRRCQKINRNQVVSYVFREDDMSLIVPMIEKELIGSWHGFGVPSSYRANF